MANTYTCVRLEPRHKSEDPNCVCEVVIGLTATDPDGNSSYIDGVYQYPMDSMPMLNEFKEQANALVSQFAADNKWIASLDSQIEAQKAQPKNVEDFESPEITIDTTVEPAPVPEPEPIPGPEPVVDVDADEDEEEGSDGE
tara:strand:+ start:123 stop:545 length:423 start_codon:yes stop_codon:yes gene_type:complete